MANAVFFGGFPFDVPRVTRKGVVYKESSAPGNGDALHLPPEDPIRRAKGDLGNLTIPNFASRPSVESPGMPFKLKEK